MSKGIWKCLVYSLVGLALVGCRAESVKKTAQKPSPELLPGKEPSEADKEAMLAAKEALFQALSGRLMAAMSEGGPQTAISICQKEALQITADIGEQQGMHIGRTGVRLRNQDNRAPQWAQTWIEEKRQEPGFGILSDETAVALLPIKLQPQCLMCHGPEEQISPAVKDKLASLYPQDRATGFEVDELRGWFWIEKP